MLKSSKTKFRPERERERERGGGERLVVVRLLSAIFIDFFLSWAYKYWSTAIMQFTCYYYGHELDMIWQSLSSIE